MYPTPVCPSFSHSTHTMAGCFPLSSHGLVAPWMETRPDLPCQSCQQKNGRGGGLPFLQACVVPEHSKWGRMVIGAERQYSTVAGYSLGCLNPVAPTLLCHDTHQGMAPEGCTAAAPRLHHRGLHLSSLLHGPRQCADYSPRSPVRKRGGQACAWCQPRGQTLLSPYPSQPLSGV